MRDVIGSYTLKSYGWLRFRMVGSGSVWDQPNVLERHMSRDQAPVRLQLPPVQL